MVLEIVDGWSDTVKIMSELVWKFLLMDIYIM